MKAPSPGASPGLPSTLQSDLEELLAWDNSSLLTWVSLSGDADPANLRWFTVLFSSDGQLFGLRLEFWIPPWMSTRSVEAVLPAHLSVAECEPGRQAAVALGMRPMSDLRASVPKMARTCARLINELWGPTGAEQLLLLTMEYQKERLPTSFPDLPGYEA